MIIILVFVCVSLRFWRLRRNHVHDHIIDRVWFCYFLTIFFYILIDWYGYYYLFYYQYWLPLKNVRNSIATARFVTTKKHFSFRLFASRKFISILSSLLACLATCLLKMNGDTFLHKIKERPSERCGCWNCFFFFFFFFSSNEHMVSI